MTDPTSYSGIKIQGLSLEKMARYVGGIPELATLVLSEPFPGVLRIERGVPNAQTREWRAYARKDTPLSGDIEAYARGDFPVGSGGIEWNVGSGTWYVALEPWNAFSESGPLVSGDIEIIG